MQCTDYGKPGDGSSAGTACALSNKSSLQDAFKKFKARRKGEMKKLKKLEKNAGAIKRTPEMKEQLRHKFLQQVLKYQGVPYHKKYHQDPQSEHYNAPLYLDCCGLVRRAQRDLERQFGFRLGRWNQAYQFDTLPIELTKEEMKPGDLVFISGTYFNPKSKKQKHDMVHVEVWMGDGEKTVGARYQRGVVQVHDSYAFESKSYYNMKYYFRSIDTWLDGICKSFCPEHEWKTLHPSPSTAACIAWAEAKVVIQLTAAEGSEWGGVTPPLRVEIAANCKHKQEEFSCSPVIVVVVIVVVIVVTQACTAPHVAITDTNIDTNNCDNNNCDNNNCDNNNCDNNIAGVSVAIVTWRITPGVVGRRCKERFLFSKSGIVHTSIPDQYFNFCHGKGGAYIQQSFQPPQ
ncbi:hypothetical protein PTSG_04199 [Salpingoeca rosetta]|uniref:NlpC/P60 domain-containing protein n=1 Tax=Salpingoeca rosetta (strain ATCC 50818 / BSB-021) TaxID=946362 RepID=F2U6V9_SALR5|nr:uncharacterized protein PTSG_04199 [Salpingoeca rosetta]EGD83591.1 hypothetical protein PTSG_04199 [Salpingoeca rosetta]|eukprot:XP_004995095.1 hypothetical protein PTSG_04199 [Salpingoeca rosetta]